MQKPSVKITFPALRAEVMERVQEGIDRFSNYFRQAGYKIMEYNNVSMGWGATALKNDDLYSPYFQVSTFMTVDRYEISVIAADRNGNRVISLDPWVACYTIKDVMSPGYIEKLDIILDEIFNKFVKYNKDNRLEATLNNIEEERKEF